MRLAALTMLAALALVAPAGAKLRSQVATSGAIRAEISFRAHKRKPPTDVRLFVFESGKVIFDRWITDLGPANLYLDKKSVSLRDLDGDGVAEALFDLYSGGAHCCFETRVFNAADGSLVRGSWGNYPAGLKDFDGDGLPEFRTADNGFAYAVSSYAGSLPPLVVLKYDPAGLRDFTRDRSVKPALRHEARSYRRKYRRYRGRRGPGPRELVRSALLAYAADQCSLGHCRRGDRLVRHAVRRHDVKGWPHFRRTVRRVLRRFGYR